MKAAHIISRHLAEGHFTLWSPTVVAGMIGCALWIVVYVLVAIDSQRRKTYGIPLLAICLNFTWEGMAAFVWPNPIRVFHFAEYAWFAVDVLIVYYLLRYGREQQVIPEIRRWFYPVVGATMILAGLGQYYFTRTFYDPLGYVLAFTINLVMSALFLFMYFARRDASDMTYRVAWLKMIGTLGTCVMCFSFMRILHPEVRAQGATYDFYTFLYVATFLLDATYVALLHRARSGAALETSSVAG
jgi:hypothetical protein